MSEKSMKDGQYFEPSEYFCPIRLTNNDYINVLQELKKKNIFSDVVEKLIVSLQTLNKQFIDVFPWDLMAAVNPENKLELAAKNILVSTTHFFNRWWRDDQLFILQYDKFCNT